MDAHEDLWSGKAGRQPPSFFETCEATCNAVDLGFGNRPRNEECNAQFSASLSVYVGPVNDALCLVEQRQSPRRPAVVVLVERGKS